MNIADLQSKTDEELQEMARELGLLEDGSTPKREGLMMDVLRALSERNGNVVAAGILSVTNEGYGFLKSNDKVAGSGDVTGMLDRIGAALSGATRGASLVLAPKHEAPIKHIEFVGLGHDRALVVLVFADGRVENRIFTPPPGQTPSSMREAANFLNALIEGKTISDLRGVIQREIAARRQEIDVLARAMVEDGLAVWTDTGDRHERLIVRGRANLLGGETPQEDLDRIRELFDDLERKRDIAEFLELTEAGEGVRIFIGSENKLFSLSGSSLVVSPYMNADRKIIGAVGVIGPTRLNYGRIVPIVDYTAQLVGRVISDRSER